MCKIQFEKVFIHEVTTFLHIRDIIVLLKIQYSFTLILSINNNHVDRSESVKRRQKNFH